MSIDTWTLRTMEEAAAYRAANPDPAFAQADAYWDARLAELRNQADEVGTVTETPVPDEATGVRAQATRDAHGRPGGGGNSPTLAQINYLAKLSRDLGYELQVPRDKNHASLIIDGAKKALAAKPAEERRPAGRTATDGQIAFLRDLWVTRQHEGTQGVDEIRWEMMEFQVASILIETLKAQPHRQQAAPEHGIREGRYAFEDAEGTTHFYRVTRRGLIRVIAGPAEHPYRGKLNAALEAIKADPKTAAALYGQRIGACGRCGLTLTDEASRALGLGPKCANKADW